MHETDTPTPLAARAEFARMYKLIEEAGNQYSDRADVLGGAGHFDGLSDEHTDPVTSEGVWCRFTVYRYGEDDNETHLMPWSWIEEIETRLPEIERTRREAAEKARILREEQAARQKANERARELRQLEQLRRKYPDA